MNKRGYEFSFVWIFAIIVGAIIIFLAIFAATRFADTTRFQTDTETAKQIGTLLTPVETNLEQAKTTRILLSTPTRINNTCDDTAGNFGLQYISASTKSNIGQEWLKDEGVASAFRNKYLFSSTPYSEGDDEFYILSKPFKFPFKVADIVVLWSDKESYCFVNAFPEIQEEILSLEPEKITLADSISDCTTISKKVCFPGVTDSECDLRIIGNKITYTNTGAEVFYVESSDRNDKYPLLYAAIFSDPSLYDCQVSRLMSRASQLGTLYREKSIFLQSSCGGAGPIQGLLNSYSRQMSAIDSSRALANSASVLSIVNELEENNGRLICQLF